VAFAPLFFPESTLLAAARLEAKLFTRKINDKLVAGRRHAPLHLGHVAQVRLANTNIPQHLQQHG